MTLTSKRAKQVAIAGLATSLIFFVVIFIVSLMSQTFAVSALAWQILSTVLVWFLLVVQFHQRVLAEQEKLDIAQLARSTEAGTIFQAGSDRAALFAEAQKRLDVLEKWFVPSFGIVIALYLLGMGILDLTKIRVGMEYSPKNPSLALVFVTIVSFLSFLISRYATGMSAQMAWKPLRSGGSMTLATSGLAFLTALSLAAAFFRYPVGLGIMAWVIPILMVVLGVEILLNAMLDFYRPRIAGQYSRSCFDSRLLGLFNEPGGLFHTVASAIDYQFGFQVSQTWFYKLLEKAILPLCLFAVIVLYLLSCFVVVQEGNQAIIEHLGSPAPELGGRTVGPGLYLKYPWPFDKVYSYSTGNVEQVNIGFVEKDDGSQEPMLWGKKHYKEEYPLLVASREQGVRSEEGPPPVSQVIAAVPVHYRIKDLYSYLYTFAQKSGDESGDAKAMLEAICYRELTRFAASAKIETDASDPAQGIQASLLGLGREPASIYLRERIQQSVDQAKLGVEILLVNLQGIHPPPQVTDAYQGVISAVQQKEASILRAKAERNRILTELCGSTRQAERLYELVKAYQKATADGPDKARQAAEELRTAMMESQGDIFQVLRQAEGYRFEREMLAKATGQRFQSQVQAFHASPALYRHFQRLGMLEETLPSLRKYIIVADPADMQIYQLDLQEALAEGIYDLQIPKEQIK
jgi:modulator of FtsH protease HflK